MRWLREPADDQRDSPGCRDSSDRHIALGEIFAHSVLIASGHMGSGWEESPAPHHATGPGDIVSFCQILSEDVEAPERRPRSQPRDREPHCLALPAGEAGDGLCDCGGQRVTEAGVLPAVEHAGADDLGEHLGVTLGTPNSFAGVSPGTSAAPARVAHLAWAVIVRATQADRTAPIQIRWSCRAPFGAAPALRRDPAQGQAELPHPNVRRGRDLRRQ